MRLLLRLLGCLAFALGLTVIHLSPWGGRFERDFGLTTLYALRGELPVPEEALVVGLDQSSALWLNFNAGDMARVSDLAPGCFTTRAEAALGGIRTVADMPRGVHTCLIDVLSARGARLIVFDVLFNRTTPDDPLLAASIRRSGRVVLFERVRVDTNAAGGGRHVAQIVYPRDMFRAAASGAATFMVNARSGNYVYGYVRELAGFPELATLPDTVFRLYTGRPPPGGTGAEQPIWLYGPPKTVPTYSLRDVFERGSTNPLPADLSGRVVFVGVSDPDRLGTDDHFKSPIRDEHENDIGGVELLATAFLNLLHDQRMAMPSHLAGGLVVFGFGLAAAMAARLPRGSKGLRWLAALALGYAAAAWLAFAALRLWLPFAVPLYLGVPAALLLALAFRYLFARTLVARLAPRQVAGAMLEATTPTRRALLNEQATVMFTDVVGSTALGDRLPPRDYAEVMSRYYDAATEAIEANGGVVVEFMGDGILAVFPESITGPDHAARACDAARRLSALVRGESVADPASGVRLRLRMGLNTGMTATGDIGARHRFNYKALGDTVNVAARLEEHGKSLDDGRNDTVLVSESTQAASGLGGAAFEPAGRFEPRGKRTSMTVAQLRM